MREPFRLPKIYRFFTDWIYKHRKPVKLIVYSYIGLFMFFMLVVSSYFLYDSYKKKQEIDKKREEVTSSILYWERVIDKYKDYRDGYFQLAVLEYRLRNFDKSKYYLDKALALDPNFAQGKKLEEVLNNRR